jgi:phosphate-selective porin OprO/OprP
LRGLGFGVGGSIGHHNGPLSTFKTPGQQTFFSYAATTTANGSQYRLDPQLYYYWGPFGILGEYVLSSQEIRSTAAATPPNARFNNTAWQIEASYLLTGEQNTFKTISPLHPFGPANGGWGAFELAVRVEQLSLDKDAFPKYVTSTSAREATSWGVGANWYLNRNVKLNLDYESTSFRGGSKVNTAVTAHEEHVILSRVQFAF